MNPLQNDIPHNVIKEGAKVLLNGSEGYILGDGTRSSPEKPNLMLTANYKERVGCGRRGAECGIF